MENKREFLIAIGKKIRDYRCKSGLTLEDLAVKCDNHKTQIARIEQGRSNCGIYNLKIICKALEMDLSEIFINTNSFSGE